MAIKLRGPWDAGFAVDIHVEHSVPVGCGPSGTVFDNTRSEAGEALFRLKYRRDDSGLRTIVEGLCRVYEAKLVPRIGRAEWVIAVPPTTVRNVQPVDLIAASFCEEVGVPNGHRLLRKAKETPALKNMDRDRAARARVLRDAFKASPKVAGKRILLLDDLFDTGATADEICRTLRHQEPAAIGLLAVTKTRTPR